MPPASALRLLLVLEYLLCVCGKVGNAEELLGAKDKVFKVAGAKVATVVNPKAAVSVSGQRLAEVGKHLASHDFALLTGGLVGLDEFGVFVECSVHLSADLGSPVDLFVGALEVGEVGCLSLGGLELFVVVAVGAVDGCEVSKAFFAV